MATINQLSAVDSLQGGDQIPVYDQSNGDARKASMTTLSTYIIDALGSDINYFNQFASPAASNFNILLQQTGQSIWLIINPTTSFALGQITLPPTSFLTDDQEIIVVCTEEVIDFTVSGSGATVVGAPTYLPAYSAFSMRYSIDTGTWYTMNNTGSGATGATSITRDDFTGDGTTTDFTLSAEPGALGEAMIVTIDGLYQERANYTVTGTTLSFSTAPPLGSAIETMSFVVSPFGTTTANLVSYAPGFAGSNVRTVEGRLRDIAMVADFGAVGDGVTDDTAAIQAAIDSGVITILFDANKTYKVSDELIIRSNLHINLNYSTITWFGTGSRITTNAFVAKAVFKYVDNAYPNNPLNDVKIYNGNVVGSSLDSKDHYVVCTDGVYTGGICARIDDFSIENINAKGIALCMTYGKNFRAVNNNVFLSSSTSSTVQTDRHIGIGFNHGLNKADPSYDDTEFSDAFISGNTVTGFPTGILAHSHFNIDDRSRVYIKSAIIIGNKHFGNDTTGTIPSRAPIYCASVNSVCITENYCEYGSDVGIDCEFVLKAIVNNNVLRNCELSQFWDCDTYSASGNTVYYDDATWIASYGARVFRKSGSYSGGQYLIDGNQFYVDPSLSDVGFFTFSAGSNNCNILNNVFENIVLDMSTDVERNLVIVKNNSFEITVLYSDSVVDIAVAGELMLESNSFRSRDATVAGYETLTQTTTEATVLINMNRYTSSTTDARRAIARNNKIYGWPNSWNLVESGSANQEWTISLISNEYDGNLVSGIVDVADNKVYIKDNFYTLDQQAGGDNLYPAHPDTPAAAALVGCRYRRGSEIPVLHLLNPASGTPSRYVMTDNSGVTWTTVSDW